MCCGTNVNEKNDLPANWERAPIGWCINIARSRAGGLIEKFPGGRGGQIYSHWRKFKLVESLCDVELRRSLSRIEALALSRVDAGGAMLVLRLVSTVSPWAGNVWSGGENARSSGGAVVDKWGDCCRGSAADVGITGKQSLEVRAAAKPPAESLCLLPPCDASPGSYDICSLEVAYFAYFQVHAVFKVSLVRSSRAKTQIQLKSQDHTKPSAIVASSHPVDGNECLIIIPTNVLWSRSDPQYPRSSRTSKRDPDGNNGNKVACLKLAIPTRKWRVKQQWCCGRRRSDNKLESFDDRILMKQVQELRFS